VVYLVCGRSRSPLPIALKLSSYFVGYYLVAFALFKVIQYPVKNPTGKPALAMILIELLMQIVLAVQLYKFLGRGFACTKRRLTVGLLAATVVDGIIIALALAVESVVLSIPAVDRALRHLAST
jgi:hypothetical protein